MAIERILSGKFKREFQEETVLEIAIKAAHKKSRGAHGPAKLQRDLADLPGTSNLFLRRCNKIHSLCYNYHIMCHSNRQSVIREDVL